MSSSLPVDRQFVAAQQQLAKQNIRLASLLNRFPELPPTDRNVVSAKPLTAPATRSKPENSR